MGEPLRIRSLAQLRAILDSDSGLVITDSARNKLVFHTDPEHCVHVTESSFLTKVVENGERNGSYFAVPSFSEARTRWPDVVRCGSETCSAGDGQADRVDDRLGTVLADATGSEIRPRPEPPIGVEALMREWTATQRIALGDEDGSLILATWPAEMKGQAVAVYSSDLGERIVELVETSDKWTGEPIPHLAFNAAKRSDRFYFPCPLSLSEYVTRWSRPEDQREVRQHELETIRSELWPWLCEQGYVDLADPNLDRGLDRYLEALARRRSGGHLRPGIMLRRRCDGSTEGTLRRDVMAGVAELARVLREVLPGPA